MKRCTIAWVVCVGLCACSGQRNENTNRLGAGKRDAAADAATDLDGEVEPREDGDVPGENDAAPSESDAGAGTDADMQGGDASGGQGDAGEAGIPANDSGGQGDAGEAGIAANDSGVAGDAVTGADTGSSAGDAGGNPNQLRIKLGYELNPVGGSRLLFSQADGGVESVRAANSEGLVVSDTAPAMVTAYLPSRGGLDYGEVITIVAPALGDYIVIAPSSSEGADNAVRYLADVGEPPASTYYMQAFAGVDACAQGYLDIAPPPLPALQIRQPTDCQLDPGGSAIATAYDEPGYLLGFASAVLPPASGTPVAVALGPWAAPETLTLLLTHGVPNADSEAYLWMRKGKLRLRADPPADSDPPPYTYPYLVGRGVSDSFDVAGWFNDGSSRFEHLLAKNRPSSTGDITLDRNDALPEVDPSGVTTSYLPLLQPSATWAVQGGSTPADAVVSFFTWEWRGTETYERLVWRFLAPPGTTSVVVPAMPPPTPGQPFEGFNVYIGDGAAVWFAGLEYYDSDAQNGYREFLKEPLRPASNRLEDGVRMADMLREIPLSGNTRVSVYQNPAP